MIPYLITVLFFNMYGIYSGINESNQVRNNLIQNNNAPLDHGVLLINRIIVSSIYLGILFFSLYTFSLISVKYLLLIPTLIVSFATSHRVSFNISSEKSLYYMGVDNKYDTFWFKLIKFEYLKESSNHFTEFNKNNSKYRRSVKASFIIMSLFEFLVLAISALLIIRQ